MGLWFVAHECPILFLFLCRDENLLESKHSRLLSQNGARNGFVEQLYLDEGGGIMATQGGGTPPSSPDEFPAGMRVLVVDDDPICLMVLKRMLQRCNYRGSLSFFSPFSC